jgi:cytidylate kinase
MVLEDVLARDARDMGRTEAPLLAAPDATVLDTSEMDVDEAVAAAVALVAARLPR